MRLFLLLLGYVIIIIISFSMAGSYIQLTEGLLGGP